VAGTGLVALHLLRLVLAAQGTRERRRQLALLGANLSGAAGGGGAITLHVTGLAPVGIAAPFLLASILATAYAVWSSDDFRERDLLLQGFALTGVAAILSGVATFALLHFLPGLVPGGAVFSAWGALIILLALFPLEPWRQLLADRLLALAFPRPIAVRELARAVEREELRADHAERLAEVGQLASAVAHEIRNPLGVILAEVKLLEQSGAEPESLAAVRAQVQRAGHFVEDLLRYARPRPLEPAELEVLKVAREAARNAQRALASAPAALDLPVSSGSGPLLEADPRALGDVVQNLVANALIATRDRPDARVQVRVEEEAEHVRIVVEDNGPGVPPEVLPRLFQAFVTGRGRDALHPGTGLGLAISARLAQRHGATLTHERPERGGARFVTRWPKHPQAPG
jgi:signal transduction histidine kinase